MSWVPLTREATTLVASRPRPWNIEGLPDDLYKLVQQAAAEAIGRSLTNAEAVAVCRYARDWWLHWQKAPKPAPAALGGLAVRSLLACVEVYARREWSDAAVEHKGAA